ncbi:MAG: pentapeptide repeat-containing protein [Caldilineaceae bacterium]|nr:pentapeptide repeat-containing protein [Caldilineaceae bacterium]
MTLVLSKEENNQADYSHRDMDEPDSQQPAIEHGTLAERAETSGLSTTRASLAYDDFEVQIGTGSGFTYPVNLIDSPAGEGRATMIFPFTNTELEEKLRGLEKALLRAGGRRRATLTPDEQAVQDFGEALFNALIQGEIRNLYDVSRERAQQQEKGLRLKLRILAPELAVLPWEFLYDARHERYVALSNRTPIVRYIELPQPVRPLVAPAPLRILGMVANPSDIEPLDVAHEKERVETAVAELQTQGLVELVWLEGDTWRDLQRALYEGPWHIFHFIGHGFFDVQRDEGFVVLSNEEGKANALGASRLAHLLADHAPLRMVLLNACESGKGGVRDTVSSTASVLVQQGIPAVLAMQYEITDQAAVECARSFYQALAYGLPVDAAMTEARKGMRMESPNSLEWGVPVLYMRTTNGVLFERQAVETPASLADNEATAVNLHVPRAAQSPTAQAQVERNAEYDRPGGEVQNGRNGAANPLPKTGPLPPLRQTAGTDTRAATAKEHEITGSSTWYQLHAVEQMRAHGRRWQLALLRLNWLQALQKVGRAFFRFDFAPSAVTTGIAASWLTGLAVFLLIRQIMGVSDLLPGPPLLIGTLQGSPWQEAVAWSAMGFTQFVFLRKHMSWAGQWVVSAALGWSLGWLVGWSLNWDNWNGPEMLNDGVWVVLGAMISGAGATFMNAFRAETVETKTVSAVISTVFGAIVGFAVRWYAVNFAMISADDPTWSSLVQPAAIYGLAGLAATIVYLSLFDRNAPWYKRLGLIALFSSLIGGISLSLVLLIVRYAPPVIEWRALMSMVQAGNLAAVLAGVQVIIALESVQHRLWTGRRYILLLVAIATLAGLVPGLAVGIFQFSSLSIIGSLVVVCPLLFWLWRYESQALFSQLNAEDRSLAGNALDILRVQRRSSPVLLKRMKGEDANFAGLDLSGMDLNGADLHDCNFTGANLKRADLSRANLTEARLTRCDLARADLRRANLCGAELRDAILYGTNLDGANLEQCDLRNALYDSATIWPQGIDGTLIGAIGPAAQLRNAILSGMDLGSADLSEINLSRADLSYTQFIGANLTQANLGGADLKGANLAQAELKGANLREARYDEHTLWPVGFEPETRGAIFVKKHQSE